MKNIYFTGFMLLLLPFGIMAKSESISYEKIYSQLELNHQNTRIIESNKKIYLKQIDLAKLLIESETRDEIKRSLLLTLLKEIEDSKNINKKNSSLFINLQINHLKNLIINKSFDALKLELIIIEQIIESAL